MANFQQRFILAKELSDLRWIDIAKKSGLDKASISQYKNGVHVPEQEALFKLASALGVSMEWLTGADVPMVPTKIPAEEENIFNLYRHLNESGKTEFKRFLLDLSSDEKYKK